MVATAQSLGAMREQWRGAGGTEKGLTATVIFFQCARSHASVARIDAMMDKSLAQMEAFLDSGMPSNNG